MILRPFLSNSIWDVYSYLGGGLPARGSFEASTQTDRKVFASVREDNLKSFGEEKVSKLVQKLLTVSRIACSLQKAGEPSKELAQLKEEARLMLPCSLKTTVEQVIRKIELGQEGPFATVETRVKKLEDFCHLDKSYGQREFVWISTMLTPDCLTTQEQRIREWTPLINKICQCQEELRRQYVEAEIELTSIVKVEVENPELQVRVALLFGKIAESFVKMEKDIAVLEKAMDLFGKDYLKFQETRKAITSKNLKMGKNK